MCGICGYLKNTEGQIQDGILREMGEKLIHRGPDDEGYYENGSVGLGHRRLSILDLSTKGHQPMMYEDTYVLVYNGEIYNYLELREELTRLGYKFQTETDTEVLLASYKQWGERCLDKFNGMWAFALWDDEKKVLFCARDRFGVKPFYYHLNADRLLFASEIKALLCDKTIKRVANVGLVYDYLTQGLVEHTNETFFEGILKLPAGSYMTVDEKLHLNIKRYYELSFSESLESQITEGEEDEFQRLFENAVGLRLRADVEVGSCLSGGLDSSSIVCCMDNLLKERLGRAKQHTFSFCAEDERIDEQKYMDAVVESTGAEGHKIFLDEEKLKQELGDLIYYQDEPFSSTGMYASYCVYRSAKENGITVLLDGQGADELLCGYRKSRIYFIRALMREKRYIRAVRELIGSISQIRSSLSLNNDLSKIRRILFKKETRARDGFIKAGFFEKASGHNYLGDKNFQYNDVFTVSLPALLRYADRNSMAFSVESRLPFLDVKFAEYCAGLSLGKKLHHGWSKYIMRKSLVMPDIVRNRKDKIGFATPEDVWLKREREYFKNIFRNGRIRSERFVDKDKLLNEWDYVLENNNGAGLFRYICLELWMRKFEVE